MQPDHNNPRATAHKFGNNTLSAIFTAALTCAVLSAIPWPQTGVRTFALVFAGMAICVAILGWIFAFAAMRHLDRGSEALIPGNDFDFADEIYRSNEFGSMAVGCAIVGLVCLAISLFCLAVL